MKHFLADMAAARAGKAPDTGAGLGTALLVLAKSEPFTIVDGYLVGDGVPPIYVGEYEELDAKIANLAFQRGVSRAIEAIGNAQENPNVPK